MIVTSAMSGTLVKVYSPSASKRDGHQLEHRVLRPGHLHLAAQRRAVAHEDPLLATLTRPHGRTVWLLRRSGRHRSATPQLPVGSIVLGSFSPMPRTRVLTRCWPSARRRPPTRRRRVTTSSPRSRSPPATFVQQAGPFSRVRAHAAPRVVGRARDRALPPGHPLVRVAVRHPGARRRCATAGRPGRRCRGGRRPTGSTPRQARLLGLLAAASLSAAFANTLFTQTVNFAANSFGIDKTGQGVGGVIVRLGVVITLPFAIAADRFGRRRMIVLTAWLAPLFCLLGALAPNFWTLVATQAVGRPLGLALALLVGVAAAEEMPRSSRAYALSVLAMASGLGAGVAVIALRLADLGSRRVAADLPAVRGVVPRRLGPATRPARDRALRRPPGDGGAPPVTPRRTACTCDGWR